MRNKSRVITQRPIRYDQRNYLRQLFDFHGSVIPLIAPSVALVTALAWGLTWLEHYTQVPQLPLAPFTVLGTALGLLLTFRTNASYDRFWEARKAWGSIVNRTRNMARTAATHFPDPKAREEICRQICGFVHSAKRELWHEVQVPELKRLFPAGQHEALLAAPGAAQRCLFETGKTIAAAQRAGWISVPIQLRMEEDIALLFDQLGICERIQKTPIPVGYALHLRRLIVMYCLSITLAFVDPLGWYSPLVVAFIAYAFLGIERAGIEIEDPFQHTLNDLDLAAISQTIENDVTAILLQSAFAKTAKAS